MTADEAPRETGSAASFDVEPVTYVVGYRRPPVATRFRPGQSGNPRGSHKDAPHVATVVAAALAERVLVKENDGRRKLTKFEVAVKQLVNRAAGGDTRATQWLITLAQTLEANPRRTDAEFDSEADAVVMVELARRLTERP
ncbi:MAG TPA: DUF5681 domain-containing protein [Roseiarcus sp.]|jgi:hypothetical protein